MLKTGKIRIKPPSAFERWWTSVFGKSKEDDEDEDEADAKHEEM